MTVHAVARSISRSVSERVLQGSSSSGRVLAVFQDACDLVTEDGVVIAVVTPRVGDGPLNVVVNRDDAPFLALQPGWSARLDGCRIQLGRLEIALNAAAIWEPRPNWSGLRARCPDAAAHLAILRRICLERAPDSSLLTLLEHTPRAPSAHSTVSVVARRAVGALREGWVGDRASLREGARLLAGLGGGLTPSGDDFLAGLMLWAWVAHPRPGRFCGAVVETAADLTTTLSAAFLRAAARGECSAAWHGLLAAFAEGDDVAMTAAAGRVLSYGATSGVDALTGFVAMRLGCERSTPSRSTL